MKMMKQKMLEARQSLLATRSAGMALPAGGAWVTEARKDALARLGAMGLPTKRDEYWKYTDPSALTAVEAAQGALHAEAPVMGEVAALRVVFKDGVFDAEASDDLALEGLEIATLEAAAFKDIHWAKELYGTLETAGQNPVERPFAAMNTAFASQGLVIRAVAEVSKPVAVSYVQSDANADVMVRHLFKVEAGASLTVIEAGNLGARFNTGMEVDVADKAAFHHIRVQGRDQDRLANTHAFARLGAEASYRSFTLTANGKLTRNEHVIEFTGDDANATVAGATMGDGAKGAFHHDDTVFITHDAVNCESRQVFKKVLRNGATGVFQGKILVKEDAQKTDGYQISQSLLLDDDSQFLAKPELEIYADDVACSHGSTTGAIDEGALFYLQSRGVPKDIATDMLVLSFLAETVEEIEDEALQEQMLALLETWLAERRG